MPALVTWCGTNKDDQRRCLKKWTVGSDDFVVPSLLAIISRLICLGFIVGVLIYLFVGPDGCENYPNDTVHPYLYGSLLALVLLEFLIIINEAIIFARSVRGTIMDHDNKRNWLAFYLIIRILSYFVEFGLLVACLVSVFGPAATSLECPEYHDGPLVFAKVVVVLLLLLLLTYGVGFAIFLDPFNICCSPRKLRDLSEISDLGKGFDEVDSDVKEGLKKAGVGKLHRNRIGTGRVLRKVQGLLCCINPTRYRSRSTALKQMADALYTVFSNDISLVPSDLIAGLILVSRHQKTKSEGCAICRDNYSYCNCQTAEFKKLTFDHMPKEDVPADYVSPPPKQFDFDNLDDRLLFEDIVHYMRYAMSIYGWPLHVYNNMCCGLCQLSAYTCLAFNYSCSNPRHGPESDFINDDCCTCGVGTIRARTKLNEEFIRYATYDNEVYMAPYCICFDHGRQSIVLTVRGTLSLKDILTDLSVSMTELRDDEMVEGVEGKQYVHTGMYNTAKEILKDLNRTGILNVLLCPTSEYWNYRLVLSGHSLGAGAVSVLALLLRPAFPDLVCFAYSTPGCIFSFPLALYSRKFITSVVLGNDVIPRTTFRSLLFMKKQVGFLLTECKKPKAQVIFQPRWVETHIPASLRNFCCGPHKDPKFDMEAIKAEIKPSYNVVPKRLHRMTSLPNFSQRVSIAKRLGKRWRRKAQDKNVIHHFVEQIEKGDKIPSFPAGNVVHIQIRKKTNIWCLSFCVPNNLLVHHVAGEDLCVMKMDRGMVDDHLPNAVMSALDQCEKEFIIGQGYQPKNKKSETWQIRTKMMSQLSDKRKSRIEETSPEPVIQQQPTAVMDAPQTAEAVPASPDIVPSTTNGNVFLTTVEVIVDGLQLEKLKKSQDKETTVDDDETEQVTMI